MRKGWMCFTGENWKVEMPKRASKDRFTTMEKKWKTNEWLAKSVARRNLERQFKKLLCLEASLQPLRTLLGIRLLLLELFSCLWRNKTL